MGRLVARRTSTRSTAPTRRGLGPLLGRYPGDVYDGDTDALVGDHPWALSTANFAELYYRLASKIISSRNGPARLSLRQLPRPGRGRRIDHPPRGRHRAAGRRRRHARAIIYHSDHFELSEQFDAATGYEKSVSNLSWSYAAYLSAIRARTAI